MSCVTTTLMTVQLRIIMSSWISAPQPQIGLHLVFHHCHYSNLLPLSTVSLTELLTFVLSLLTLCRVDSFLAYDHESTIAFNSGMSESSGCMNNTSVQLV